MLQERRLVFASGLSILIALFEALEIEKMGLAGGALREGVLYSMIPELHHDDIRARTINSLITRYHIDQFQAQRVAEIASLFIAKLHWTMASNVSNSLLFYMQPHVYMKWDCLLSIKVTKSMAAIY